MKKALPLQLEALETIAAPSSLLPSQEQLNFIPFCQQELFTRRFDMEGSRHSSPGQDWETVRGKDVFNNNRDFGWTKQVSERDVATNFPVGATAQQANLYRDFHWGAGPNTFKVFLGRWAQAEVTVYTFASSPTPLGMVVRVENGESALVAPGTKSVTLQGNSGADGILEINFNGIWVVNGIEVSTDTFPE
jgi:hypothetical protein